MHLTVIPRPATCYSVRFITLRQNNAENLITRTVGYRRRWRH